MDNGDAIKEELDTSRKALFLNLDDSIYGSFAEIGGGQEVARFFFQSGGASGTIAKTISAYDMVFSDAEYGKSGSGRYVSEPRLLKMLDKEYSDIVEVLGKKRGEQTRFFSFANTVATINYKKTNEAHGWVGVRFQLKPNAKPNEVVLHVKLLESDSLLQQKTLGILGVNLIYACYYNYQYPNSFLKSLFEGLDNDRLEIDMIRMSGPDLDYVDNRLLAVQLVKNGMTNAIMFDRYGNVKQPSDMFYKKNIMVLRGSFRPITYAGFDMLKSGFALFKKDVGFDKSNTMVLCEITLNNLLDKGSFDERDFLDRVDILCGMGQNVMVSDFREFYKLSEWLGRFKLQNIRMVIGALTFRNVIDEKYYDNLKGGVLEAFGKLFIDNLKIYIYPGRESENCDIMNYKNIPMSSEVGILYKYLFEKGLIIGVEDYKESALPCFSHIALDKIKNNDTSWEDMVPKYVSAFIKEKKLFGYTEKK